MPWWCTSRRLFGYVITSLVQVLVPSTFTFNYPALTAFKQIRLSLILTSSHLFRTPVFLAVE